MLLVKFDNIYVNFIMVYRSLESQITVKKKKKKKFSN
jgi:hypothetical protein